MPFSLDNLRAVEESSVPLDVKQEKERNVEDDELSGVSETVAS